LTRVARFFLVQHAKMRKIHQNCHKIYQRGIKYSKGQWNRPNGHKIYQHLSLQDTPQFTQIGNFGLILATLFLTVGNWRHFLWICNVIIFLHCLLSRGRYNQKVFLCRI
jgi:hypothetical protein